MKRKTIAGFTLLEMMVAMTILAGLSFFIAQTLRTSLQNRSRYQNRIEVEAALRDTIRLLRNDIGAAYHYVDLYHTFYNDAIMSSVESSESEEGTTQSVRNTESELPLDLLPIPQMLTGFLGQESNMTFTVNNHRPMRRGAQESDLARLTYSVRPCPSMAQRGTQTNCLFRRVMVSLGEMESDEGTETRLIENVESFELSYLGPNQMDFVSQWNSHQLGAEHSVFPYAVKIFLSLKDPQTEFIAEDRVLAPIHFPNNPQTPEEENRRFRGF